MFTDDLSMNVAYATGKRKTLFHNQKKYQLGILSDTEVQIFMTTMLSAEIQSGILCLYFTGSMIPTALT